MNLQTREYTADQFATNKSRLYKPVTDLKTAYCIYLLENSYETPIRKIRQRSGRVSFYQEDSNARLTLVAVRYISNSKGEMVLAATSASCTHQTENLRNEETFNPVGSYQPVTNPDQFLEAHKEHIKLYYIDKLRESEQYKNLVAHSKKLFNEGIGTDGYNKHLAIEKLLFAFETTNLQTALKYLNNVDNNNIYREMTKPRPNYWLCFNFTANDPTTTTTYRLLSAITQSDEYQELIARCYDPKLAYVPIQ